MHVLSLSAIYEDSFKLEDAYHLFSSLHCTFDLDRLQRLDLLLHALLLLECTVSKELHP